MSGRREIDAETLRAAIIAADGSQMGAAKALSIQVSLLRQYLGIHGLRDWWKTTYSERKPVVRHRRGGRPSKDKAVTDDEIRSAVERHKSFDAAGKALGLTGSAVGYRARKLGLRGARSPEEFLTDEEVRAALSRHSSYAAAARDLNVKETSLYARARAMGLGPGVIDDSVSDAEIIAAVRERGSFRKAAEVLTLDPKTVSYRAQGLGISGGVWHGGRTHDLTDQQVQLAVEKHGDYAKAARALGVPQSTLYARARKLGI